MPKTMRVPALCASAALLSVSGCAGGTVAENDERPVVLTTFSILEDMVEEVGGDRVDVRSITPQGAEVHEYDPTPGDIRDAAEADLIIQNGLGLEEWYGQFIDQTDAESVTLTEDIDPRPITRVPGHPDDAGDAEAMPEDPHAWMSPLRGEEYVDAVEEALTELSPEDAEHFGQNADRLRTELTELLEESRERAESVDGDVHVVSCEGAFGYLAEDLGFEEHYLWPLNADGEGTPQQVQAQIEYVQDHEVPVIFCETTVNDSAQQQVADGTGAELGDPLYVDSLSEQDGPAASWLELLSYDVDLILEAAEAQGR